MKKILNIVALIFSILLLVFFYLQREYINASTTNYTNSIKKEIEILIDTKRLNTLEITKNLAIDDHLIKIIKNNNYDLLYKKHFFSIADDYKTFKHIGIHIIDNKGIQRYVSWTKKSLGKSILYARPDLAEVLKKPKITSSISSGLFDLTFKGIVPIFDKKNKLLAVLEVITHFNSISKELEKQKIYGALILTKKRSVHIKYNIYGKFIDGYFISNIHLNNNINNILKSHNIKQFLQIPYNSFSYIGSKDDIDGYFIINVPIYSNNGEIIANYVAFIKDSYELKEKEIFLNFIMLIITILFIITGVIAYKQARKNEELIESLNEKIEKEINEKLELIYLDSLTKAYKKTKLEIDKAKYYGQMMVMLNIKNFSKINDFYGFKAGDEILTIVVQRIENILNHKIYRINGDEFVFFSKNLKDDIQKIKEKFINDPIQLTKNNVKIRLSFNFSAVKNEGGELLRKLSIALKESKRKPFQDVVIYEAKEINSDFIKFNSILYDAIFLNNNAEIVPYFQGIHNNQTNTITKYESLARLKTDEQIYSPFFFIDIAKSSGFLFEITKIMIDKTLKYLSTLPKQIEVSINITEEDLLTHNLKNYLLDKLEEYKINPARITLEILEGITSNGTKNNILQLKELKDIGFKLAIDDFGVEYSNFERINELDVDFIKIDAKYIKTINTNPKSYEIAKAITNFAHSLKIKVVAEYVENEEIQEIIKELGIEYSQGYYFSKPEEKIIK